VERFVTIPVEIAMNSVQRKTNLRSQSLFGLSVVTLVFEDNVEDYVRQATDNRFVTPQLIFLKVLIFELTPPTGSNR